MTDWYEAHAAPQSFEGRNVWQFSEMTGLVTVEMVPTHYSRTPEHSYGLWWAELVQPGPPSFTKHQKKSDVEQEFKEFSEWGVSLETLLMAKEIAKQLRVTPKWVIKTAIELFAKRVDGWKAGPKPKPKKKVQCPRCFGDGKQLLAGMVPDLDDWRDCPTCDGVGMVDEWRDR